MDVLIRKFQEEDIPSLMEIWNTVVDEANAFPQVEHLEFDKAYEFFAAQTYTGVAVIEEEVVGLYILHPNNVGRCGHIANASYAVKAGHRGQKIGEKLVMDSLSKGFEFGFTTMQFNAVVSINKVAIHLYEKLGFQKLGVIPNGFLLGDGTFSDIILYYILLS